MNFPQCFISASHDYSTLQKRVPAPYLRKSFNLDFTPEAAEIIIGAAGFYLLFVNGHRISKGYLAPYISNPDNAVYFDRFDVSPYLKKGKNAVALCLGNGFQNNFSGYVWDFDKARFCAAPKVALRFCASCGEEKTEFESSTDFVCHPSPILSDDYRLGEDYDARLEINGFADADFDDSGWKNAVVCEKPRGTYRECTTHAITEISRFPVKALWQWEDGYIFDFGINNAGTFEINIDAFEGQELYLHLFEHLYASGEPDFKNLDCDCGRAQTQIVNYICKQGVQKYIPSFTYFGYRYVFIKGITPEQAEKPLFTYIELHSDLKQLSGFNCSNDDINKINEISLRSTLSNFFYFPTDCPQREKNGWTGDAALSSEHTVLYYDAEKSYREWLFGIRCAMDARGALPGIVPTGGWGFHWGNGPIWDSVLTRVPFYIYKYRGDTQVICDNAHAIFSYLDYISKNIGPDGLIEIGLGDWLPPGRLANAFTVPVKFTDTVTTMDICKKACIMFRAVGYTLQADFAASLFEKLKSAVRSTYIDTEKMTACGDNCQSAQAMAVFYSVFDEDEKDAAVDVLIKMIENNGGHLDCGIAGARALFPALGNAGHADTVLEMLLNPTFPSYKVSFLDTGASTLYEYFERNLDGDVSSLNHHCWAQVSGWFLIYLAGIRVNPSLCDDANVDISPAFPALLDYASGYYESKHGRVSVLWERTGDSITLNLEMPEEIHGNILLPDRYFIDSKTCVPAKSGKYIIKEFLL